MLSENQAPIPKLSEKPVPEEKELSTETRAQRDMLDPTTIVLKQLLLVLTMDTEEYPPLIQITLLTIEKIMLFEII